MSRPLFCWQCGRALNYRRGVPVYVTVTLPGGNKVRVHKICEQGAKDAQRFDTVHRRVVNRKPDSDEWPEGMKVRK